MSAADQMTEDYAAAKFVECLGRDLRFCHTTGGWFRWTGAIWEKDRTKIAFHCAREFVRELAKGQQVRVNTSFVSGVVTFAKSDPLIAATMDQWDIDPMLLGTPNGTVNLTTGELGSSNRNDGITKKTLVPPARSECPRWRQFLTEVTAGDSELIRFLQQWCGYSLCGSTREHALVFIYGAGGNGKSVFLNVVTSILNDYAKTAAMDTFSASQNDKHPTELAMLRGARMVATSETEDGRAWAETRIKQMTGGDTISARFMRQDYFEYKPQFKLTIVGNHKPLLKNVDDAARRRFLIVPFDRKPASPDRELERKLLAEAPAILQWMIEGCLDWQANGLVKSATVLAATEEYFCDQDLFAHWLAEECVGEPGNMNQSEKSGILYKSWKEFAVGSGNSPGSQQSFKDLMNRHGFRFHRSSKSREFFGISLRPGEHNEAR